jgi:hypothetical protein
MTQRSFADVLSQLDESQQDPLDAPTLTADVLSQLEESETDPLGALTLTQQLEWMLEPHLERAYTPTILEDSSSFAPTEVNTCPPTEIDADSDEVAIDELEIPADWPPDLQSLARHLDRADRSPTPKRFWLEPPEQQQHQPASSSPKAEDGPWSTRPSTWKGINNFLDMCEGECWYEGCLDYLLSGPLDFETGFAHARNFIASNCTHSTFKIGISGHPHQRWTRKDCGYFKQHEFTKMKIIWIAEHSHKDKPDSTGAMEKRLIEVFNKETHPNCINRKGAGGEAPPRGTPQFGYVVYD